jgi:hypothetical protein
MAVEILAPMRSTLAAIEAMRRRGGGAIVNIGSTSALGHGHKHSPWPAYGQLYRVIHPHQPPVQAVEEVAVVPAAEVVAVEAAAGDLAAANLFGL